jgi:hypothetical protein
MTVFNEIVLFLHFIGLALGLSVSFSNIAMSGIMAKAAPAERPVLARFPPVMARVGRAGLALLWATGLTMAYTRWNGIGSMPWQFHVKLALVIVLTVLVFYIHRQELLVQKGDAAAMGRLQTAAKGAMVSALLVVLFAVLAFD